MQKPDSPPSGETVIMVIAFALCFAAGNICGVWLTNGLWRQEAVEKGFAERVQLEPNSPTVTWQWKTTK